MELAGGTIKGALSWSFLTEFLIKLLQPLSHFLLMLFLAPSEFGIMTSAFVLTSFAQIFWEGGLTKELIRRDEEVEAAANIAFYANVSIATFIYLIAVNLPESLFARFAGGEQISDVVSVMAIYILLGSLCSVHVALLQKKMDFKNWSKIKLTVAIVTPSISIPLAYLGYGVWSLVIGAVIGQAAQVLVTWFVSDWRPALRFGNAKLASEMARFCFWVTLSSLLFWFYAWVDSLIVGLYFGTEELGIYRSASVSAAAGFGILFAPILPVLYSSISANKSSENLSLTANFVISIFIYIAIPLTWALFYLGDILESTFLGEEWAGFGTIFSLLVLKCGYSWIVGANGEFYRSLGRPEIETIVTVVQVIVYLICYLFAVRFGFDTFVQARVGLVLVFLMVHVAVLGNVVNVDIKNIFLKIVLVSLASASIFGAMNFLLQEMLPIVQFMAIGLLLAMVLAVILFLEKNGLFLMVRQFQESS